MNIHSIKFQLTGTTVEKIWNFSPPRGKFSNVHIINGDNEDFENFRKVIAAVFFNEINDAISSCGITLDDNSGEAWTVEMGSRGRKVYRNRVEQIGPQAEIALRSAMKNYHSGLGENPGDINIKAFGLAGHGFESRLFGDVWNAGWEEHVYISRFLNEQMEALVAEINDKYQIDFVVSKSILAEFCSRAESTYWSIKANQLQLDTLMAGERQSPVSSHMDLAVVKKQIQIIDEIEGVYAKVIEPGTSISARRSFLNEVNEKIKTILADVGLTDLPNFNRAPDWTLAIELLTRLQILERLVHAVDQARCSAETNISKILVMFNDTVGSLLTDQSQLMEELESCLASISVKLADHQISDGLFGLKKDTDLAPSQSEKIDIVSAWLGQLKLLKPILQRTANKSQEAPLIDKLELAKTAIEFALGKFYEIRVGADNCKEIAKGPIASIDDFYESQVKNLVQIKTRWIEFCKEFALPPEMKLKQLLKLATSHYKLLELSEKAKLIEERIGERKILLQKLEELVMQWRSLNNSQKRTKVESSTMLVNEARSILQYKEDRQKQLSQHNRITVELTSHQNALNQLELFQNEMLTKWKEIFRAVGIAPLSCDNEQWQGLLSSLRKAFQYDALLQTVQGRNFEEMLVDTDQSDLAIWSWGRGKMDTSIRLQFLKGLENSSLVTPNIFVIPDGELIELSKQIGISVSQLALKTPSSVPSNFQKTPAEAVAVPARERKTVLPRASLEAHKEVDRGPAKISRQPDPLINPKAQAVLEILNKRPRNGRIGT